MTMRINSENTRHVQAGLHIPWSWLTIGLLVLTIASLGTLIVVVSITNVDILSTVALALAVLAFAAQLIVSMAQSQGTTQQLTQTEQIHSQTQSALADVRSTANALLSNQSEQFNKVLSAVLHNATTDAVREFAEGSDSLGVRDALPALDPEDVAVRVEAKLRDILGSQLSRPRVSTMPAQGWNASAALAPMPNELVPALQGLAALDILAFCAIFGEGPRAVEITGPNSLSSTGILCTHLEGIGLARNVDRRAVVPTENGLRLGRALFGVAQVMKYRHHLAVLISHRAHSTNE